MTGGLAGRGQRLLPLAVLVLVLCLGAYLRLTNLGAGHFYVDELNHHYAAESLRSTGQSLLPSGSRYPRGTDITWLVSVTQTQFEDREFAARLPSALFGILALLIFGAAVWRMAGPWPAVWSTALLALFPEALEQSRTTRFYTEQLVFGLVALYAGWRVVCRSGGVELPDRPVYFRTWGWAALTLVAFGLAARVQVTTGSAFAGWAVILAVAGVADLMRHGRQACRRSVPLQLATAGVAGALVLAAVAPGVYATVWRRAQSVPLWAGAEPGNPLSYYWFLQDVSSVLISLAPVAVLVVLLWRARLALYLALWFAVPFLLHSFVLAWKLNRYMLLAYPGLLALFGTAAAIGSSALYRVLAARLRTYAGDPAARVLAGTAVALAALFAFATTPGFQVARRIASGYLTQDWARDNWTAAARVVDSARAGRDIPVGVSEPLAAQLYGVPKDFVIRRGSLDSPAADGIQPEGSPDWYSGDPVLTSPISITRRFPTASEILFVVDSSRWISEANTDSVLRRTLESEAEELCAGACGRVMVFRWAP